jgi:hypothetical protein
MHIIASIINDDEKFRNILRGLNQDFHNKVVTTQEIETYISTKSSINFQYLFDQYLRTNKVPVLEYQFKNGVLNYRYANCNQDFAMPVKTNLTKDNWLRPTVSWQSLKAENQDTATELKIDINFYITLLKVD